MKKIQYLSICTILFCVCATSQTNSNETRYFDENNVEISELAFNKRLDTRQVFSIPGDSTNHKKLIEREKHGKISNRAGFKSLLEQATNSELDSNKPLVIIYYPGKDRCNSGDSVLTASRKFWFEDLEAGLKQIAKTAPIYIYKNNKGLKKYDGFITWYKDPEGMVEKLFFKHHYPCSSFVVISKEGKFISYFGEYSKELVWKATQKLITE